VQWTCLVAGAGVREVLVVVLELGKRWWWPLSTTLAAVTWRVMVTVSEEMKLA
jgi:hypothetical protein